MDGRMTEKKTVSRLQFRLKSVLRLKKLELRISWLLTLNLNDGAPRSFRNNVWLMVNVR